jgi:hypothetical protein
VTLKVPTRLLRITASKPFGLIAAAGLGNCPPALFTSTSMRPKRPCTASTKAPTFSASRMSHVSANTSPPRRRASSTTSASGSGRRPQIATRAPSSSSSSTTARPMPVPPPVTSATRS